jgi:hypothetical protein
MSNFVLAMSKSCRTFSHCLTWAAENDVEIGTKCQTFVEYNPANDVAQFGVMFAGLSTYLPLASEAVLVSPENKVAGGLWGQGETS